MKIQDLLLKTRILLDLPARNRKELVGAMATFLASSHHLPKADFIVQRLLEREEIVSTGIGYGIAVPHCRVDNLDRTCMVAARTQDPVDYAAIDDRPVRLVFMIVSPSNTAAEHAQLLSALSRIVSSEAVRKQLLECETQAQFLETLVAAENTLGAAAEAGT